MSHTHTGEPILLAAAPSASSAILNMLRQANLRPTRQRVALAKLLFTDCKRHVTAESLHVEALANSIKVSLATIYNSLHQFERAGLLRQLSVDGQSTVFDTNISHHNHFLMEPDQQLIDIPGDVIQVDCLPQAPAGWEVASVDVVVRLRKSGLS